MSSKEYKHVEDGWYNELSPSYVCVDEDRFNSESLVVNLSFNMGEEYERPSASIPLLFGPGHKIAEWNDEQKTLRDPTREDQQKAFALLGRIFPKWVEFCKAQKRTTHEMLYWFDEHSEDAKSAVVSIKVGHTANGFCYAHVKDPANEKKKRKTVVKNTAMSIASSALESFFGNVNSENPPASVDDDGIGF